MIDFWVESLALLIKNSIWLAPFIAFLAGLLTSFTPCSLSSIPLVIGYVGGTGANNTKKAFKLSLSFSLGMAVTFTVLGTIASIVGKLMGINNSWWYLVLGVLMILMSLQVLEIFSFIPSTYLISKNTKKGYLGAFIAGILGGVFSSPCATPVLVVLLGIVARGGDILRGIMLLLFYAIGHSVLVIMVGTSIGFVKKLIDDERYGAWSQWLKAITGIALLLIGFYMFYLGF